MKAEPSPPTPDQLEPAAPTPPAAAVPLTLTVPQAAKMLQIGRNQVYALIHAGRLPFVKLGNRYLIPHALLCAWLEEQATNNAAERQATDVRWLA